LNIFLYICFDFIRIVKSAEDTEKKTNTRNNILKMKGREKGNTGPKDLPVGLLGMLILRGGGRVVKVVGLPV